MNWLLVVIPLHLIVIQKRVPVCPDGLTKDSDLDFCPSEIWHQPNCVYTRKNHTTQLNCTFGSNDRVKYNIKNVIVYGKKKKKKETRFPTKIWIIKHYIHFELIISFCSLSISLVSKNTECPFSLLRSVLCKKQSHKIPLVHFTEH